MGLFILIYFVIVFYGLITKEHILLSIILIALIPFIIFGCKLFVKNSNEKFEKLMKKAKEDFQNGFEIQPFINPNTVRWEVLSLIPGVSTLNAKRAANERNIKGRRFTNMDEFSSFMELDSSYQGFAEKVLKF